MEKKIYAFHSVVKVPEAAWFERNVLQKTKRRCGHVVVSDILASGLSHAASMMRLVTLCCGQVSVLLRGGLGGGDVLISFGCVPGAHKGKGGYFRARWWVLTFPLELEWSLGSPRRSKQFSHGLQPD